MIDRIREERKTTNRDKRSSMKGVFGTIPERVDGLFDAERANRCRDVKGDVVDVVVLERG